jgi:2-desacetyl-2-hydroxyethyl bacteriochlorophyllide A dehydrogenase
MMAAAWLVGDLAAAIIAKRPRLAPEILRFRWEKLTGRVNGIWRGATMTNPLKRERLLFNRAHRAVVIRGPGRAALEELELPPLRPGDVLVRVAYAGVSGVDLAILDGAPGRDTSRQAHYPIVPGHELSGTVAAVGARIADVRDGDRVVVERIQGCGACAACRDGNAIGCAEGHELGVIGRDGAYGQYVVTPGRFVHRVPPGLGLREAALCQPLAVVLKGLRRLERVWRPDVQRHTCAVIGAGAVGHLAARILGLRGHAVTVFDDHPARRAALADSDVRTTEAAGALEGFDAIVETTGAEDALARVLATAAPGAALLLLGGAYGQRSVNLDAIAGADRLVVGSAGSAAEDFEEALATLPKVDVSALTRVVMTLDQFRHAWSLARAGEHVKILLAVDEAAR